MKKLLLIALAALMTLGLALTASSQEDEMTLAPAELAPLERPPVEFNHDSHAGDLQCVRCHHDFDEFMNNQVEEDGASCSDCHSRQANADNPVSLRTAFHKSCKGCHEDLIARNRPSGPVTCGMCHKRAQKAK